ncbi:MAG: methionyl-tRNA formyltransferase [Gammaproteobacteria bacterium]|nr:methionyl-tRNA formyltransferase [Gammaproteobacteria bacterium]
MLKIIYAGTPDFAVSALEALLRSEHNVVAVYTQPDRPAGRGRKLQPSPVKTCALAHNIPLYQPESFKENGQIQEFVDLQADLMVVTAYGLILPQPILQSPRYGCINIHASLLPRWRGAAPIQRAILAGDACTGITIMQMDKGLDTGDMLAKQAVSIQPSWNAGELHDELQGIGAKLLMSTLGLLTEGAFDAEIQDHSLATYANKLVKSEAAIDWRKSSIVLDREIRAFAPWPVSFTSLDGQSLRIWRANVVEDKSSAAAGFVIRHDKHGIYVKCGTGTIEVTELQLAGKNRTTPAQLLNARNLCGCQFEHAG